MLEVTDNLQAGRVVAPPGVIRYDGDDPYLVVGRIRAPRPSPTRPMRSRRVTGTGWVTRSPPAGPRATTTRRWRSRPRRVGIGQVPLRHPGPRCGHHGLHGGRDRGHVRRCLRQRDAALRARQPGGGVRPPAHLHRPSPDPATSFAERQRFSRCPALLGRLDPTVIWPAVASVPDRQSSRFRRPPPRRWAWTAMSGAVSPISSSRRSSPPRPTCSGTAGSAPT